jgi:hypothetical protein
MKNILLINIAASFLILCTGCTDNGKEKEPVKISFTEYSLAFTDCWWTNIDYDDRVIIIINSEKKLQKYISYMQTVTIPKIDFAKNTLILACGYTTSGIQYLSKKLFLHGNRYILEVKITLNDLAVMERWNIALVTDKFDDICYADLNVITIKN